MKIIAKIFFGCFFFYSSCSPSTDSLYEKAYKLEGKGKYKEAIEVYAQIIKRNPKLEDAFLNRGICYLNDSNYTMAHDQFQRLLNKRTRGNYIYRENNEFFYGSEVAKHEVSTEMLYYHLGIAKYYLDSLSSSYPCFQYAIDHNYDPANSMLWQGLIWTRVDSLGKACSLFGKARFLGDPEAKRFIEEYCDK